MAAPWYLAPSLAVLRQEINARWPNRDRTSDGTIGDQYHKPPSDHLVNSRGSVNAIDIDADGVQMAAIIEAFQRHPSAHYWIWRRTIADRDNGWQPRAYTGSNPHTGHAHFSIRQSASAEQDRRPWGLLTPPDLDDPKGPLMIRIKAKDAPARYLSNGAHIPSMAVDAALDRAGVPLVEVATTAEALALLPSPVGELDYVRLVDELLRRAAGGPS